MDKETTTQQVMDEACDLRLELEHSLATLKRSVEEMLDKSRKFSALNLSMETMYSDLLMPDAIVRRGIRNVHEAHNRDLAFVIGDIRTIIATMEEMCGN